MKILIEDGVILKEEQGERWRIDLQRLPDLHVPTTLTAVLQARLDALPEAERVALQQAAVVGRIFWDVVIQVLQAADQPPETALKGLARRELIYPREASAFVGTEEFIIKHALLRDVVYESVLKRLRRVYHHKTAEWLAETTESNGRVEEYAALIASHYDKASEELPAAEWYIRAGKRAKVQGALQEASMAFNRALELLPESEDNLYWSALYERSKVFGMIGDSEGLRQDAQMLLKLAQESNDVDRLAEANVRWGVYLSGLGNESDAIPVFKTALAAARQKGNGDLEAKILGMLTISLTRTGEIDAAATIAEEALQRVHDIKEEPTVSNVLINIAVCFGESGNISRAITLILQAIDINHRLGDRYGELVCLSNVGYDYVSLGLLEQGITALKQSMQIAEGIGARRTRLYSQLNLGLAYLRHAELTKAQRLLEDTLTEMAAVRDEFARAACLAYLALAFELSGKAAEAAEHYTQARELFNHLGILAYAHDSLAGLARCALSRGEAATALEYASQLWNDLSQKGSQGMEFPIWAYLTCAQVFEATGDSDRCHRALKAGYADLMARAEKISTLEWRASFLSNIPEHQDLTAWHQKVQIQ